MKYYILAIKNYATIQGRTTRREYWMFVLFNIIFSGVASILDRALGLNYALGDSGLLQTLYSLFTFVPGLTAVVRRLHDIGKSGWWLLRWHLVVGIVTLMFFAYLFVLVGTALFMGAMDVFPRNGMFISITLFYCAFILAAIIWLLALLVKRGTPAPNKYGPDPNEFIAPVSME
jgi:uncharacterized membrane protein YhaH (DUF805 family)